MNDTKIYQTQHCLGPAPKEGLGWPSGLERVRQAAIRDKNIRFTALFHHITPELLWDCLCAVNSKAVPGVDGVGYDGYVKDADINIEDLHRRLHSGKYKALPSLRCYIPKQNGGMRPPGIAAIEDQVVQCAVVEVLSSIYEVDFFGNSYGFRPEIGWHNALDKLYMDIPTRKVNWIVVADIRSFFDSISHDWLVRFLEHRIGDPRILRLIKLWLKAGFVKDGKWANTEVGSAGGSSASPQLANIFLHYVLDLWVAKFAREADEEVHFARYVDDFVTCFQSGDEAVKFLESLKLRLAKFGL